MKRVVRDANGNSVLDFDARWKQFRKKPVVIFATLMDEEFMVETLEGTMRGSAGDYLIQGVNGEYYPCKPDIFEKTYELAYPKTASSGWEVLSA